MRVPMQSAGGKLPCATHRAPRRHMRDEGRPLGAGLQELASNHLKLQWSRAIVVSVKEKVPQDGIR